MRPEQGLHILIGGSVPDDGPKDVKGTLRHDIRNLQIGVPFHFNSRESTKVDIDLPTNDTVKSTINHVARKERKVFAHRKEPSQLIGGVFLNVIIRKA